MNKLKSILIVAAIFATACPLLAQQKRVSPHETISTVIDGDRVTVVYGRPYTKDHQTGEMRKIWGGLVPYGQVWRTGADEATLFITQKPIVFGDKTVPAGAYTTTHMSRATAYAISKAFWSEQEALIKRNPAWRGVVAATIPTLGVKLHPGALRYYDESGIPVPAAMR